MLLSYNRLVELLAQGVIRGVDIKQVNASSIDVRLGGKIKREAVPRADESFHRIDLAAREPLHTVDFEYEMGEQFVLRPGEFILAQTQELFYLPRHMSSDFCLKSTLARQGVGHMLAGWCDAGWNSSVLTLEIKNSTEYHEQVFTIGMRIGQMKFYEHETVPEHASYAVRGRYNGNKSVEGVLP